MVAGRAERAGIISLSFVFHFGWVGGWEWVLHKLNERDGRVMKHHWFQFSRLNSATLIMWKLFQLEPR